MFGKHPALGAPRSDWRRNQRVILNVPVTVASSSRTPAFEEEASTLVVSTQGGLIALCAKVERGEALRITNRRTGAECACKVVHISTGEDGKAHLEIEFAAPSQDFWGIVFPPKDWGIGSLSAGQEKVRSSAARAEREARPPLKDRDNTFPR